MNTKNTKKANVVNILLVKLEITSIYKNELSQRQLLHWHPEKFNLVKSLRKDDELIWEMLESKFWNILSRFQLAFGSEITTNIFSRF